MSTQISPAAIFQSFLPNGQFNAGGQVFTYAAGTVTPQATFTDSTGAVPNTNPVILNAMGQAPIWLTPTQAYKYVVQDQFGNPLYTTDQINGALSSTSAALTSLVVGVPAAGTNAVVINGNTTDAALIINAPIAAGIAVQVNGNVNQTLNFGLSNNSTGNAAATQYALTDGTARVALAMQNVNCISSITGGVNGRALTIGGANVAFPLELFTNNIVRATIDGTTGNLTLTASLSAAGNLSVTGTATITGAAATGNLTVTGTAAISGAVSLASTLGINGATPPAQSTGWGTPTGPAVVNNFSGTAATNTQIQNALAEIITVLKAFGLLGA
jgi:hypothetical protein